MKELLLQAASVGINPVYVNKLLDAFEGSILASPDKSGGEMNVPVDSATGPTLASKSSGILSARELEVLRLLANGASSKEVAGDLFISLGTAKKHIKNIYRKLDVHKQTSAVARAQELGLI